MGTRRIEVSGAFLVEASKRTDHRPRFYVVEDNPLPSDAEFVTAIQHPDRPSNVLLLVRSDEYDGDDPTPLKDTTFQIVTIDRLTRRHVP